jgi:acyl transferase domain-containing protein
VDAPPVCLPVVPWLVSARTPEALPAQAAKLLAQLAADPEFDPVDVGYSLAATRSTFPHRAVVLGGTREELLSGLAALAAESAAANVITGHARPDQELAVLFPPATGDPFAVGDALYRAFPRYAEGFDEAATEADKHLACSLRDVMAGTATPDPADEPAGALWQFAHQVGLHRLLTGWGLTPDAVSGTAASAYAAGTLTLGDAALVVASGASEVPVAAATVHTPDLAPGQPPPSLADTVAARGITLVVSLTPGTGVAGVAGVPTLTLDPTPLSVLTALARAHCQGFVVAWPAVFEQANPVRVPLPTYAFQHTNYWWVTAPPVAGVPG